MPVPLRVHGHYSRREGVLWNEACQCDLLFVTLKKSEALFSPSTRTRGLALGPSLLHIVQMTGQREPGYARRFCSFVDELEVLSSRPVDLLTESMIHNPYFREDVDTSRRLLLEL